MGGLELGVVWVVFGVVFGLEGGDNIACITLWSTGCLVRLGTPTRIEYYCSPS